MAKIFLFMEDAVELAAFEGLLRKLGFDVMVATRAERAPERAIAAGARLAIVPGRGKSASGAALARKLRSLGFKGSVAVTWPQTEAIPDDELADAGIDGVLADPVDPVSAVATVAELCGLDPLKSVATYERLQSGGRPSPAAVSAASAAAREKSEIVHVKGRANSAELAKVAGAAAGEGGARASAPARGARLDPDASTRAERNRRFLAGLADERVDGVVPKGKMRESSDELKAASQAESGRLSELDASKRDFVKALYRAARDKRGA